MGLIMGLIMGLHFSGDFPGDFRGSLTCDLPRDCPRDLVGHFPGDLIPNGRQLGINGPNLGPDVRVRSEDRGEKAIGLSLSISPLRQVQFPGLLVRAQKESSWVLAIFDGFDCPFSQRLTVAKLTPICRARSLLADGKLAANFLYQFGIILIFYRHCLYLSACSDSQPCIEAPCRLGGRESSTVRSSINFLIRLLTPQSLRGMRSLCSSSAISIVISSAIKIKHNLSGLSRLLGLTR